MKHWDIGSAIAKLELAHKSFRTTFAAVDPQWTDAARRDFVETYVEPIDPRVRSMLQAISRLAETLGAAERQCDSES